MSNNFKYAIEFTLPWETGRDRTGQLRQDGGYSNYSTDPGGETKWGISKKAHPNIDIKNLTLEGALDLYKKEYYDTYSKRTPSLDLDSVERQYAVAIFDTGVNCGPGRAFTWHLVAQKEKDPTATLLGLREQFYVRIGGPNLKGWIARLTDLKKHCEILSQPD